MEDSIRKALSWTNWTDRIKSSSLVFVKPNFTWPKFRPGVVTSPIFLQRLLPILKERADRVVLGESDLSVFRTSKAFRGLGIDKICKEAGVETVELTRTRAVRVQARVGRRKVSLLLPKLIVDDVDALVNVPVPKCHVVTTMSAGMKNLYGLVPSPHRGNMYRHEINRVIVGINKIVRSQLVVVDGSFSLSGRGPIVGTPIRTNVIIASDNVVVADSAVCRLFEMDPTSISYLRLAEREGLGTLDLSRVHLNDHQDYSLMLRPKRSLLDFLAVLTFRSRIINRAVMDSPLSRLLYHAVKPLRSKREIEQYEQDMGKLPESQYKSAVK